MNFLFYFFEFCSVVVRDEFAQNEVLVVRNERVVVRNEEKFIKYFVHQHNKYVWQNDSVQFSAIKIPDDDLTLNNIIENSIGLTHDEHKNA